MSNKAINIIGNFPSHNGADTDYYKLKGVNTVNKFQSFSNPFCYGHTYNTFGCTPSGRLASR